MTDAQLLAGGIAVALVVVVVAVAIRWRMPSTMVIYAMMLAVPGAGFATYALRSGPPPDLAVAASLTIVIYGAGVAMILYSVIRRARRRDKPAVWVMATDARRQMVALIVRWLIVLWISTLTFLFEPAFAVANVAVNLLWMLVWLPRRFRTWKERVEIDISAPPTRVFEFVSDVRNWTLYQEGRELVRVTPDGPLTTGSEYVARVVLPQSLRRTSYQAIESRYRVTAMVPGQSFDVTLLDQDSTVRTVLEPSPSGTRLSRTTRTTMGLLRAWSADMLNNQAAFRAIRPREQRNRQRLKEILEAAPDL